MPTTPRGAFLGLAGHGDLMRPRRDHQVPGRGHSRLQPPLPAGRVIEVLIPGPFRATGQAGGKWTVPPKAAPRGASHLSAFSAAAIGAPIIAAIAITIAAGQNLLWDTARPVAAG